MVMALTVFSMIAGAIGCVAYLIYDPLRNRANKYLDQKTAWATKELDVMFVDVARKRLQLFFIIGPLGGALAGWVLMRSLMGAGAGALLGAVIPQIFIMQMQAKRRKQFQNQLVDALMLMSSSLKAGLSILQAFEVLTEEMPAPMSQEIGLVLKENKMGVSFQDALVRLKQRMPSDDLTLFVTSLLVARESGGDVTTVFSRLVETLRERKKMKERVTTLTMQARIQGVIMMLLPIGFAFLARSFNPEFFQVFFTDPLGRMMLLLAIIFEIAGAFLIWLFGRVTV